MRLLCVMGGGEYCFASFEEGDMLGIRRKRVFASGNTEVMSRHK